eukprot:1147497-Pelagomonas_calceolata.AAC.1
MLICSCSSRVDELAHESVFDGATSVSRTWDEWTDLSGLRLPIRGKAHGLPLPMPSCAAESLVLAGSAAQLCPV